jgi:hypothetical protein
VVRLDQKTNAWTDDILHCPKKTILLILILCYIPVLLHQICDIIVPILVSFIFILAPILTPILSSVIVFPGFRICKKSENRCHIHSLHLQTNHGMSATGSSSLSFTAYRALVFSTPNTLHYLLHITTSKDAAAAQRDARKDCVTNQGLTATSI